MASKKQKPDGLTLVKDSEVKRFFEKIPASKLFGVGPRTADIFEELGIKTSRELAQFDTHALEKAFGQNRAKLLQDTARGVDDSLVEEKEAQQISRMGTLKKDTDKPEEIMERLKEFAEGIDTELMSEGLSYRTISIIAIDTHLQMRTKSHTTIESRSLKKNLDLARELLEKYLEGSRGKLRRVGIRVSGLSKMDRRRNGSQKASLTPSIRNPPSRKKGSSKFGYPGKQRTLGEILGTKPDAPASG
ncbi:MAG TPA: hypothetical protein VJ485_01525, partial [archaeon]|nr:hypothetical protein [archaeon]